MHASAAATFYAPSDISGVGGMRYERIRAVPQWRGGPARYDCVFVETDPSREGMRGLDVARVLLFFQFEHDNITYPCALVQWYSRVGDEPNEDTGMWIVEPDLNEDGSFRESIIHLDTILRAAHLIGVYGEDFLPQDFTFHKTLDTFESFFVNKYIDHHAFATIF